MRLVMLPLAFSVAYIAYENRDRIIDQYTAAYPVAPAKEAALERCISETRSFNRLDADDRQSCYRKYRVEAVVEAELDYLAPMSGPGHRPANDNTQRQTVNDGCAPQRLIVGADTTPSVFIHPAASQQRRAEASHQIAADRRMSNRDTVTSLR
jgi:hypothetical protein